MEEKIEDVKRDKYYLDAHEEAKHMCSLTTSIRASRSNLEKTTEIASILALLLLLSITHN